MPGDTMTDVSVAVETTVSYTHKWLPLVVHRSQLSPLCPLAWLQSCGWDWHLFVLILGYTGMQAVEIPWLWCKSVKLSLNLKLHRFVSFCVLNSCNTVMCCVGQLIGHGLCTRAVGDSWLVMGFAHMLWETAEWSWALHTCCGRQLIGHGLCTHAVGDSWVAMGFAHMLWETVEWSWALHTCCGKQLSGHGLCTHAMGDSWVVMGFAHMLCVAGLRARSTASLMLGCTQGHWTGSPHFAAVQCMPAPHLDARIFFFCFS